MDMIPKSDKRMRRVTPDEEYERLKRRWTAENPEATAEEYTAAMQRLAREAGV